MMIAQILTAYAGAGKPDDEYRPALADDYPLQAWRDITGQAVQNLIPDPNLLLIEVTCNLATLAAIEADGDYLVIWSEEVEGE